MATKDIAIACQGGGSHAAYTGGVLPVLLAEFDNLGAAQAGPATAYRESGTPPGVDVPVLVAISGTSGGAISALLGWYGFLTGGAPAAQQRLDAFWDSNCATHVIESNVNYLMRTMSDAVGRWGWDVKSSPYSLTMTGLEMIGSTAWPLLAAALGAANPYLRPDFFSLQALLAPGVDWPLVSALGEFASIPLEVQRWQRSDLEMAMYAPGAPCQAGYQAERALIETRIERKLAAAERLRDRLAALDIGADTLLGAAFARWQPPPSGFERASLDALSQAVHAVTRYLPHLMIGAVELHQGDFVAFSSERAPDDGGISLDAVLASAAVPWLFRAHDMPGTDPDTLAPRQLSLWDGLFSQNPPLSNFLAGVLNEAKKPDEIWVVQIDPNQAKAAPGATPQAADRLAMSGGEIWDLRNALAGNLALNQEIGFVEAINRRVEAAPESDADGADGADGANMSADARAARWRDKLVQVDRIVMDGAAIEAATGLTLAGHSKLDRDPRLKAALCEHGRLQAHRYLALRRQIGALCGALDDTLACACGSTAGMAPADSDGAACRASVGRALLVIDGATVYRVAGASQGAPRALVRWRAIDAEIDGRPVRIEGRSELADDLDADDAWRVKAVRITSVAPRKAAPPTAVAAHRPARSGRASGARPQ